MPLYRSARAFLEAVYERHRSVQTYTDTGLSRSLGTRGPRLCTFETSFQRPNLLRFAFERPHPSRGLAHLVSRCVVGHDGTRPFFWASHYESNAKTEHPETLDLAVAGATGISSGTAHTIAALLLPEVTGFKLLDLHKIRFRRNRKIDGVPCTCVSGLHPFAGRLTAWFGTEDLLLRRLYRQHSNSEELRFAPLANAPLPETIFDAPPGGHGSPADTEENIRGVD